jgi:murein DD-endopeptidase MepM/ murein hydrolase activator NlpD
MAPQPRSLLLAPLLAVSLAAGPLVMAQQAPIGGDGGDGLSPSAPAGMAPAGVPEPIRSSGPGPAAGPAVGGSPAAGSPAAVAPASPPPAGASAGAMPPASPSPGAPKWAVPGATVRTPEAPAKLVPSWEATRSAPGPLVPGKEQRSASPATRFDQSLDELVRDGVVSQREVRIRPSIPKLDPALRIEGCRTGAFSQRECGLAEGGLRFQPRYGGEADPGNPGPAVFSSGAPASGERTGIDAAPLPPIAVPVSALLSGIGGRFRLTDVFQVTPRPAGLRGNGNSRLIFPLIGEATTSSGFGWRLHPILGSWMMHSGRDLAAPEGTPVVAALAGRVVSSGEAGGYGLAIEVEHDNPRRRTLYGHLSELYVKEGDKVRQGEVIGRVGSTGRSTGPHLHFELRMPQEGGWVAVDPGELDPAGTAGVTVAGLPGLPGMAPGSGAPPDAVALLLGQLIQSLERPRPSEGAASAPLAPVPPLPTDRLPQRLPAAAALPAPAPLPRNLPFAATPER